MAGRYRFPEYILPPQSSSGDRFPLASLPKGFSIPEIDEPGVNQSLNERKNHAR